MSTTSPRSTALESITAWLDGKAPGDLETIEIGEKVFYKENIVHHRPSGEKVTPILIRVPNGTDMTEARLEAMVHACKMIKRITGTDCPKTIPDICNMLGTSYWDELDTVFLLAKVIHRVDEPHGQFMLPDLLWETYRGSLATLAKKLDALAKIESPQFDAELSEEEFKTVLDAIARRRSLSPLAVIAGRMRDSFVLSTAVRLHGLLTAPSGSQPPETSTPEP